MEGDKGLLAQKLIEIVNEIASITDYRSTVKKDYCNLGRRLKLLTPMFEEIIVSEAPIGEDSVRALISLKEALDSAKDVLRLGSEGSHIYLVLEREQIMNKFHEVTANLEHALSELSYETLDISDEVKEQVELVLSQFRRAKGRIHTPDVELYEDLLSLYNKSNDVSADLAALKRVSEKLQLIGMAELTQESLALHEMVDVSAGDPGENIKKMSLLLKQIKDFVQTENPNMDAPARLKDLKSSDSGQASSEGNRISPVIPDDFRCPISPDLMKDPVIVSTGQTENPNMEAPARLKGLTSSDSGQASSEGNHISPVIPDDFRCPISLDLMKDPVIVSTGQTYERASIKKWLEEGLSTCPKTQKALTNTTLTPNYVLRSLIAQWCESNGIEPPKRPGNSRPSKTTSTISAPERTKIENLLQKLSSSSPEDQLSAAGEIRLLAKRNTDNRIAIAEAGAIPLLAGLLKTPDSRIQEHAVTSLLNLSICEDNKESIISSGALPGIVHVLKKGSMETRENAAATLFSLSVIDENKVKIGLSGAIPPLVILLSEGTQRGKKDAAIALFNLCIYQGNKGKAVRAGVVPTLMRLLTEPGGAMVDEALAILAILSSNSLGKAAIGAAEAVPVLVEVIGNGSPRNRENAAAVLVHLCSGDQQHMAQAQELCLMDPLIDLAQNGTERGKRKAAQLLERMSQFFEQQNQTRAQLEGQTRAQLEGQTQIQYPIHSQVQPTRPPFASDIVNS